MKLHTVKDHPGKLVFQCPACGNCHFAEVAPHPSPRWTWNGSMDRPTFSPSILVKSVKSFDDPTPTVCHSFVTDGRIQFLNDCTHSLAGQTVELPDW